MKKFLILMVLLGMNNCSAMQWFCCCKSRKKAPEQWKKTDDNAQANDEIEQIMKKFELLPSDLQQVFATLVTMKKEDASRLGQQYPILSEAFFDTQGKLSFDPSLYGTSRRIPR